MAGSLATFELAAERFALACIGCVRVGDIARYLHATDAQFKILQKKGLYKQADAKKRDSREQGNDSDD